MARTYTTRQEHHFQVRLKKGRLGDQKHQPRRATRLGDRYGPRSRLLGELLARCTTQWELRYDDPDLLMNNASSAKVQKYREDYSASNVKKARADLMSPCTAAN